MQRKMIASKGVRNSPLTKEERERIRGEELYSYIQRIEVYGISSASLILDFRSNKRTYQIEGPNSVKYDCLKLINSPSREFTLLPSYIASVFYRYIRGELAELFGYEYKEKPSIIVKCDYHIDGTNYQYYSEMQHGLIISETIFIIDPETAMISMIYDLERKYCPNNRKYITKLADNMFWIHLINPDLIQYEFKEKDEDGKLVPTIVNNLLLEACNRIKILDDDDLLLLNSMLIKLGIPTHGIDVDATHNWVDLRFSETKKEVKVVNIANCGIETVNAFLMAEGLAWMSGISSGDQMHEDQSLFFVDIDFIKNTDEGNFVKEAVCKLFESSDTNPTKSQIVLSSQYTDSFYYKF